MKLSVVDFLANKTVQHRHSLGQNRNIHAVPSKCI
jgi:hypothetical protein